MKTKVNYLVLVAIVPLFLYSQPYFTRLTPFPQENTINHIAKVPESNRIVAVGNRSTVLVSDYYGTSWEIKYNPGGLDNNAFFTYVCFINSSTGFISGNRGILKTTDAGNTWYEVYSNVGQSSYDDIAFANQSMGFAVGEGGNILKTTDGGESWEIIDPGVTYGLYQIEFLDPSTGIITGGSTESILKTTDGGDTWEVTDYPQGLPDSYIINLFFLNSNKGFAFADDDDIGYLLRTTNGGQSWDTAYSNPAFYSGHFDFSNSYQGIMVSSSFYSDIVVTTNDGGETWTERTVPGIEGAGSNYVCYNDNNVYITGNMGKMFKSFDNGITWDRIDNRIFYGNIYQMQFFDTNTGYVLSADEGGGVASSTLWKTVDGGENWSGTGAILNDNGAFWFINENMGFLCEHEIGLTVSKTTDGGANWTTMEFPEIELNPFVIKFYDENNGLIAGEGPVMRTTDGGETWQQTEWNSKDFEGICDICYKSESEVYVTGEPIGSGTFIGKSLDGGLTWQLTDLGNYGGGNNVVFTDENTAFIACGNSTILKSTDGGESWQETTVNTSNFIDFKALSFPSATTGYAVGDGNYENFFMTNDGGDTWNPVNSGTSEAFASMNFFDENNGLVGGSKGVLYRVSDEMIQFNPPQNIEGDVQYICPLNIYYINWDIPDTTNTPELIAFKVYRFGYPIDSIPVNGFSYGITDTVTGLEPGFTDGQVCYFVTAVYNSPYRESIPTEELCIMYLTNVETNSADKSDIIIHPNPAFNEITIENGTQFKGKTLLSVYDINGKVLIKREIDSEKNTIDISALKEGLYFMNIKTEGRSETKKFIKTNH